MSSHSRDKWTGGQAYENFMGRWSPHLAAEFIRWLDLPAGKDWLDVGCGTGALSRTILAQAAPARVMGVDPSEAFVAHAREITNDPRAKFEVGGAQKLPVDAGSFDAVVSGLVLNFIPNAAEALQEFKRALRSGGTVAAYVWDYAEGMQMLRIFWDAVIALDPPAEVHDEGPRFPLNNPDALTRLFREAELADVETSALEFTMEFKDSDDYWQPFLGGVGPGPAYVVALSPEKRDALQAEVRARLPIAADGSIALAARAWAVKGKE